jgi:hypothetical protein
VVIATADEPLNASELYALVLCPWQFLVPVEHEEQVAQETTVEDLVSASKAKFILPKIMRRI